MKKANLKIPGRKYQDRDGNEKTVWIDFGALMESDGGQFLLVNPGINLAAYMESGHDQVLVKIFEEGSEKSNPGSGYRHHSDPPY